MTNLWRKKSDTRDGGTHDTTIHKAPIQGVTYEHARMTVKTHQDEQYEASPPKATRAPGFLTIKVWHLRPAKYLTYPK